MRPLTCSNAASAWSRLGKLMPSAWGTWPGVVAWGCWLEPEELNSPLSRAPMPEVPELAVGAPVAAGLSPRVLSGWPVAVLPDEVAGASVPVAPCKVQFTPGSQVVSLA